MYQVVRDIQEPDGESELIIYKTKNECGQILHLEITGYRYSNVVFWYVMFWIGKRKFGYQALKQTGKDGLKSLLWAKECLKNFIDFSGTWDIWKRTQHICIGADNGKRRDVYERGLRDLGFTQKRIEHKMWLHKCVQYG